MTLQAWSLVLVTTLLWGLVPLFDKLALTRAADSPLAGVAVRLATAALIGLPLLFAASGGTGAFRRIPPTAWGWFAASGLASLVIAQIAWYALLKDAQVSKTFPFMFAAAPVVTLLLGVLVLHEPLTLRQVIGGVLVVLGGALLL
ncbi:MAG: EamA family transporter [Candidatus Sericytochromatia bacterium]|nr:EamA family transporter [Candidatus Tanganyikabacteria bacterium]